MDNNGNIFDNYEGFSPVENGQGEVQEVAEDTNPNMDAPEPQEGGEGQVPDNGQGEGEIDYRAEYERLKKIEESYQNLRPKFTQVTQELSSLRKNATAPRQEDNQYQTDPYQQQQQYGYQQPQPTNPYEVISQYVNQSISQALAPIQEQNAELQMQNEVSRLAQQHPDFTQLAPQIQQYMTENPDLWNLGTSKALQIAYSVAKTSTIASEMDKAVSDAKNEAYRNKEIKVLTGSEKARPNTNHQQPTEEQLIKESILNATKSSGIFL